MFNYSYEELLNKIFTLEVIKDYSLDKVRRGYFLLWNPLKNIKVIHIAWTNWKGSVSKMVFSILKNSLKRVWVFTSPHLLDIRERFITQDWEISMEDFTIIANKIFSLWIELSYFETCTLIAFLYFEKKWVEYAIIEVGIGWLKDSTNIVNPVITCITSISFDHMEFLWNTFEDISYQKAWIIKDGIPIFINHDNPVIEEIAKKHNSLVIKTNRLCSTNLLWEYQKRNAGLAYEIAKYLWITENNILEWLQKVEHRWRLEKIRENVYIDWAHNVEWLIVLKEFLDKTIRNNFKNIVYIFSLKKWKDISLILNIFWKESEYIIPIINKPILEKDIYISMKNNNINVSELSKEEIIKKSENESENFFIIFWSLYMIWEFLKYK